MTLRLLIALFAGLALGMVISATGNPFLRGTIPFIEPLGTLWVNAIRMTVVPLVISAIVVGVTSAPDSKTIGRIGGRALALFLALLLIAGVFTALVAPPLFQRIPLDDSAVAALRATAASASQAAGESITKLPTVSQWIVDLIPVNPVKAAADGAMLPLIVFSVLFGLAVTRIAAEGRALLERFFKGVADTSLTLVRWVLLAAPIGVFALAVPLAARLGASAAGALAGFVLVTCLVTTAFVLLVLYPIAAVGGGISILEFAKGVFPAQAVAFSARSSLGALPAMMEAARTRLKLPEQISSFFLPLAASTFRIGGVLGITCGVLFIARLYGVPLSTAQLVTVILTVTLITFSIPGIPAGSIVAMVPALVAAGLPVEGMGVLLAIDAIPDMFRTTANVTGDMTAAVVLGRAERAEQGNSAA